MPVDKAYLGARLVGSYDERHFGGPGGNFVLHKDLQIIRELMGAKGNIILDIPCGTGIYTAWLRQEGYPIIGADASWDMLRLAKAQRGKMPWLQTDIFQLPFASGSLPGVMVIRLFQHLTSQGFSKVLEEARRVIRPDGWVLFDTLRWSPRRTSPEAVDGMHVYSLPICRRIIRAANLEVISFRSTYLFSAIRYRRLPVAILKALERVEVVLPADWKLRTFWLCGQ